MAGTARDLGHGPTDTGELRISAQAARLDERSFSAADVEALYQAATDPPARATGAWPTRDVAIIGVLAGCGLRASELCALSVKAVDRRYEVALVRVTAGAKGGKRRSVPLPHSTLARTDSYLDERRAMAAETGRRHLAVTAGAPLFVRRDGTGLNQQFLDTLLRRLCRKAGVELPAGAMAHALRHQYGTQLALRNLPLPVLQQLLGHADPRTTSIYTTAAEAELAGALLDAGWLHT